MNNYKRSAILSSEGKISFFYATSLLFAGLYLFGHINQLQSSLAGTRLLNITNILMCILGVIQTFVAVFIVFGKKKLLKFSLYAISALYFFGNFWIIKWLYTVIRSGDISFNFVNYQYTHWRYLFNNTTWASSNADTLLLNYANAVLWYCLARDIDSDKKKSCIWMGGIIIVSFILPIIFYALTRFKFIPNWWIEKSLTLFVSYISILVVMLSAKNKKSLWDRCVCSMIKINTPKSNNQKGKK